MPMTTRSRANAAAKSEPETRESVCNPAPRVSAPYKGGASSIGASTSALPSTRHPRDEVPSFPNDPSVLPSSTGNGKRAHTNSLTNMSCNSTNARELAAKLDYARRLAQIDEEREKAASDRAKALAELELQAKLASISCSASRSSKSAYIENWLVNSFDNNTVISEHTFPIDPIDREIDHGDVPFNASQASRLSSHPPAPTAAQASAAPVPAAWAFRAPATAARASEAPVSAAWAIEAPVTATRVSEAPVPETTAWACEAPAPSTLGAYPQQAGPGPSAIAFAFGEGPPKNGNNHTSIPSLGVGTHHRRQDCNRNMNKNENNNTIGTPDNFIMLANAIADLGKKTLKVSDLPRFDGRALLDWLPFKRAVEQTKASFSPRENVSRIAAALQGPAREAVWVLLTTAEDPEVIMKTLEARFAKPEFIVLQQLALVKNLPRLNTFEGTRELNIFACRIRNCVEVIRFLNQPEYLAAPDLVNTIVGKLTPLLRSRWVDFAAASLRPNLFKIEILADFLENEANLHIRFGLIPNDWQSVNIRQPVMNQAVARSARDKTYTISATKPQTFCSFCNVNGHEIGKCKKFLSIDIDARWKWVIDNKVCRRCLKRGRHQYRTCRNTCEIDGCPRNLHHTALHRDTSTDTYVQQNHSTLTITEVQSATSDSNLIPEPTTEKQPTVTVAHNSLSANKTGLKPLLKVIAVCISGPLGSVDTYALLDDGSSVTLLDQTVADSIGATGSKYTLNIDCIGGLSTQAETSIVAITVKGKHHSESHDITARTIPNLNIRSQGASLRDVVQYDHLVDIADHITYDQAKPMLLIGADNWHLTLPQAVRQGSRHEPAAALTALGWVLLGHLSNSQQTYTLVNHIVTTCTADARDTTMDVLIKDYFKLDSIGISKVLHKNSNDRRAIQILENTTKLLDTGMFQTGLLWRDNIPTLPDSRQLALSRFYSLERKMAKDSSYADAYRANIRGVIEKGYAELCSGPPLPGGIVWYLPHFGVVHPHKKKLRVVHDAAAKCANVSLNSLLLTGPDLLQPLLAIAMRFREGPIAMTGDIREMFPQVKIRPEDRDAQRFLWRDNPEEPIREYRMSSMIFGAASSPYTALWIKNNNALRFQTQYPGAAKAIIEDHYMDDYLASFDSVSEAATRAFEIVSIHKAAHFDMRSWVSNHKEALALIPPDLHASDPSGVHIGPTTPSQIRVLGFTWNVKEDKLYFVKSLPTFPNKCSKRSVLSLLMSIYDPFGFLMPVIMKGRVLFQRAWRLGADWDEDLPNNLPVKWRNWFHEIKTLSEVSIPRCYMNTPNRIVSVQLHVFADASERAYACVAYWRFTLADQSVHLSLIGAKGRLAPLKPVSVPRLELQAALIAARFSIYITEAAKRKPDRTIFWSDSLTVLKWLRSDACTFKAFVSFRVGEIVETTNIRDWKYVPTALNVADDATRDTSLTSSSRWFKGPSFLLLPESDWPLEPLVNVPPVSEELKGTSESVGHITTNHRLELPSPVVADHRRFSKWIRFLRSTARAHQCAKIFRPALHRNLLSAPLRDRCNLLPLSAEDLKLAESHIFRQVQFDSFSAELIRVKTARPVPGDSRLRNLTLVIGDDHLLRLSGRTTACRDVNSYPIVLDGKHPITRMLIRSYHFKFSHGNNELVVNEIRTRFHVLSLRPAVRSEASRCQLCRNRKAKPVSPPLGPLPDARLAHTQRPFTYVGLDYFGPLSVTVCRRKTKRWVALFTCMTIRAVHLEIVENLSSDSAIMALRRFISRRGYPTRIYSDNGTSFVGAAKMLPDLYNFCSNKKIEWRFIPPSAPFMGGCWERMVRLVKSTIAVTLKERSPKEEILHTLLLEAECIANSRPLTHVPVEQDSDQALTPFSFLLGTSSNDLRLGSFEDADLSRRCDWRKAQRLADHLWQRFVKEYLPTLVPRRESAASVEPLCVGDLVFIADGALPRNCWPRGRIIATYPGKDGVVRVVDVKTKRGVLRRPTRKVALLVAAH